MLNPSAHADTFARDNLPPFGQWPDLLLDGFDYPRRLNAAVELTDAMVERGFADHTALIGNGRRRTYKELADWTNRLARALVEDLGVKPGNRILIRSANNPALVACWLAATKAGAVVVNTARGDLVDDDALIAALRSGRVAAAGLDVFAGEPNLDPRYRELDNTFLLPHLGSASLETRDAMGYCCLDNLDAFFAGRPCPNAL